MRSQIDTDSRLFESEAIAVLLLVFGAALMAAGWSAGTATARIGFWWVLAASVAIAGCAWMCAVPERAAFDPVRFAGFALVSLGAGLYILFLSWPSFLPVSDGPDLVHHLALIHFIQQRHALPPTDGSFGAYLGEMSHYPPGSHLVAALVGAWLGADGLRIVQPVFAVSTALKAGLVYCVLLRVQQAGAESGADRRRTRVAAVLAGVAGTSLLFVPHAYLLQPVTRFSFYAQVVSELFTLAMLWALVGWWQSRSRRWLALFGMFGVAVVLCWPVLIPIPLLSLAITAIARSRDPRRIAADLLTGSAAPVLAFAAISARGAGSAGILGAGGSVLVPQVGLFGWPFLVLASAGLVVGLHRRGMLLPILVFVLAAVLQIGALATLQHSLHAANPYLAFKTVHLLVHPAAILAGTSLTVLARSRAALFAVLAGAAIVLAAAGLPSRPMNSPITEDALAAGEWARDRIPASCVDYMFPHWLTGYWLHFDVLGNPREAERSRTETFEYRDVVGRWIEPGSLKYAIAGPVDRLPWDARRNMRILQRFGEAAVVERSDGRGACPAAPPPIRDVPLPHER